MVLISTLGGMAIVGLNGFVIGTVIAAMFMSAWDIYVSARNAEEV
jgi:predicted PurR-regulated permease PerM